jgi:hypothetical protein
LQEEIGTISVVGYRRKTKRAYAPLAMVTKLSLAGYGMNSHHHASPKQAAAGYSRSRRVRQAISAHRHTARINAFWLTLMRVKVVLTFRCVELR